MSTCGQNKRHGSLEEYGRALLFLLELLRKSVAAFVIPVFRNYKCRYINRWVLSLNLRVSVVNILFISIVLDAFALTRLPLVLNVPPQRARLTTGELL
jgi:hypothetical protein